MRTLSAYFLEFEKRGEFTKKNVIAVAEFVLRSIGSYSDMQEDSENARE